MIPTTGHPVISQEQDYLVQSYRRPAFVLERGEGVYLYDDEGQRYLDMVAGIAVNALGYGDAGLVAAMREAAGGLIHVSNLYHTHAHAALAERLIRHSFADRLFFCNSGAEAIEGALKFARRYAATHEGAGVREQFVAFQGSFHGRTLGALSVTATEKYRAPFEPLVSAVHFGTFNDPASFDLIGPRTAAVIVEPIQGEGGMMPATDGFLRGLREACDRHGALLIFDEVQCGLGRSGTLWAHEPSGVEPDLMALAKPLGGGLPIGALLASERVAETVTVGDHGSTFGGGPFVCAVASYVFDRLSDPAMLAHVNEVGAHLGEHLRRMDEEFALLAGVRGRGLMWGLELAPEISTADVVQSGYDAGLLLVGAGRNTLRFVPPLVVEKSHIDEMAEALHGCLMQVIGGAGG